MHVRSQAPTRNLRLLSMILQGAKLPDLFLIISATKCWIRSSLVQVFVPWLVCHSSYKLPSTLPFFTNLLFFSHTQHLLDRSLIQIQRRLCLQYNNQTGADAEGANLTRPEAMALLLLVGPMREVYNWRLASAVTVRKIYLRVRERASVRLRVRSWPGQKPSDLAVIGTN